MDARLFQDFIPALIIYTCYGFQGQIISKGQLKALSHAPHGLFPRISMFNFYIENKFFMFWAPILFPQLYPDPPCLPNFMPYFSLFRKQTGKTNQNNF